MRQNPSSIGSLSQNCPENFPLKYWNNLFELQHNYWKLGARNQIEQKLFKEANGIKVAQREAYISSFVL